MALSINGRKAGTMGDCGLLQFLSWKNLGAFGEAGAVVTNDPELRKQIQMLRDQRPVTKYYPRPDGWNCRMDGIQAAVLSINCIILTKQIPCGANMPRNTIRAFAGIDEVLTPFAATYARHVYHVYAIRVQERDVVARNLQEKRSRVALCIIRSRFSLQEACRNLGYKKGSFPISESLGRSISFLADVSRTDGSADRICHPAALAKWLAQRHSSRKKQFENSRGRQMAIHGSGALFWRGFLGRAGDERGTSFKCGLLIPSQNPGWDLVVALHRDAGCFHTSAWAKVPSQDL